jgi:arylsulfatase A-like enzyme
MKCLFTLLSAVCLLATAATATEKPLNIVFILADDLGWSDTTLHGLTKLYQTPNIERLAQRGMTFTRAYSASPLCSPTRSAILTGLSPARTGITTPNCHLPQVVLQATPGKSAPPNQHAIQPLPVTRLMTDYPSLTKTLKTAGYATGHFGKWHLGPEPYSPLEHGFDVDIPHHPGPGPAGSFVAPWKFPNFKENTPGEHLEDRMAAEAVAWMEQNKDRPFFLNYWQFSVHAPFDAKPALIEKYRPLVNPNEPQRSPTYAAMIESFDDAIGTLLDALDRLHLAERTIILFTSDNGGNMYNEVDGTTPTSNAPLRGGKASLYEGGVRVPTVIAWPGLTPAGSRSEALLQSEDFYPTLLEALALNPAEGQRFDGTSLLPAFKGDPLTGKAVFQYFPHSPGVPDWLPPSVSVHRDDWKLIRIFHAGENGAHRYQLFNLAEDLGEKHNRAADQPARVKELDALIGAFLAETQAVLPLPNPNFDPAQHRPELEGKQQPKGKAASKGKAGAKGPAKVGRWQHSPHATPTRVDQQLHIQSSGGDPWIATLAGLEAEAEPLRVQLTLSSQAGGRAAVFFTRTAAEPFHKDRSVSFAPRHDGEWHEYQVALPTRQIHSLRLDPATQAGLIRVTQFQVQTADGKVLLDLLAP